MHAVAELVIIVIVTSSEADVVCERATLLASDDRVYKHLQRFTYQYRHHVTSAALHRVPAVSIMSSTMMTSESCTEPTRSIRSTSLALALCLMIIASPASISYLAASPSLNFLALYTPPASGETTTGLCKSLSPKYLHLVAHTYKDSNVTADQRTINYRDCGTLRLRRHCQLREAKAVALRRVRVSTDNCCSSRVRNVPIGHPRGTHAYT